MSKKIIICLYIKTIFITLFSFAHASNTGVVLEKDQKEFKFFSSIYTQTKAFDSSGSKIDEWGKTGYWSNYFSFYKGITSDVNWGFQFNIKSVKTGTANSSALNAIQFSSQSDAQFGLTSFGPQFKWKPVEDNNDLSLSISFSVPLKTDLDGKVSGRPYLDSNGWKLNSRIYYNYSLNDAINLFCETGFDYIFDTSTNSPAHSFSTPAKIFPSYNLTKWSFYLNLDFSPTWNKLNWSAYYFQVGPGIKYLFSETLEPEIFYSLYLFGKNKGAGNTIGAGVRYIF